MMEDNKQDNIIHEEIKIEPFNIQVEPFNINLEELKVRKSN